MKHAFSVQQFEVFRGIACNQTYLWHEKRAVCPGLRMIPGVEVHERIEAKGKGDSLVLRLPTAVVASIPQRIHGNSD